MGKVTKTSKTFAKKHLQSTISRRKIVQKVKRTRAEQESKRGAVEPPCMPPWAVCIHNAGSPKRCSRAPCI